MARRRRRRVKIWAEDGKALRLCSRMEKLPSGIDRPPTSVLERAVKVAFLLEIYFLKGAAVAANSLHWCLFFSSTLAQPESALCLTAQGTFRAERCEVMSSFVTTRQSGAVC